MAKQHQKNQEQSPGRGGQDASPQRERSPYPPGFSPSAEARKLYKAMKGIGTDERAIFDVLHSGRSDLNRAIERAFNRMYGENLRKWLISELSGSDERKALQLLGRGDFTLAQKLHQAADGWGTDEEKIFHALERASASELAEVRADASLMQRLNSELNDDDYQLAYAYLRGQGTLAARLRRSVNGWGTDEAAIWRAISKASEQEKRFVLSQPSLMNHLRSDLDASDYLRARRMLDGSWDNADRIEVAMAGWGTDESMLISSLSGLTQTEFNKLNRGSGRITSIAALHVRVEGELSGDYELEALSILHQKRLLFDPDYFAKYMEGQKDSLGAAALEHEGASALMASSGQSMSSVQRLILACRGAGTDEESIWDVCATIPAAEGQFIRLYNPEGVMGILRGDLSTDEYFRVRSALGGGAMGRIEVLRQAVEGMGTNEGQLYDALDTIIADGLAAEVLTDSQIMRQVENDIDPRMYVVFRTALKEQNFTPRMRLKWATARYGTDEELVWSVCEEYGSQWHTGGEIDPGVDAVLESELSTRDYWKAIDLIRGPAETEQDKLARSKELLERERGAGFSWAGASTATMDAFSDSGQNADEAWRDYQVTYNQAYIDGEISEEESQQLDTAREYSEYTTEQYREAKATVAQWASQIAITIVGIAATILTAGSAGPFVVALAARMGGSLAITCEAMVAAAVLKVGITKAIEGEGYDLASMDAIVDGVGASIEAGLFVVGNLAAAKMMTTSPIKAVSASVEQVMGRAGTNIVRGGLDGAIDGTIGGLGEGLFRGLANERSWDGDMGQFFSNVGTHAALHGVVGTGAGFGGGAFFKSLGEAFGPLFRKSVPEGAAGDSVDDVLAKMPDDLEANPADQARLFAAVKETHGRMNAVSDDVASEVGVAPARGGIKGNKIGAAAEDMQQEPMIRGVLEKTRRWGEPEKIGSMRDMSRSRFDLDNFDEVTEVAGKLETRLQKDFGAGNVDVKPPRKDYKRYHILATDPKTGITHEFQVGTKALTHFIEKAKVDLPAGVTLHGNNFHVVMYDVLDKLYDDTVRATHGIDGGITARIGLDDLKPRYNTLMVDAGTVPKGMDAPTAFDEQLKALADDLSDVLRKLEAEQPGLATKLDTKLAVHGDGAAGAVTQPRVKPSETRLPEADAPEVQPDMPAPVKDGGTTDVRVRQDDPLPGLRDEHKGTDYEDFAKARPFVDGADVNPHAARQGQLGDCYLLAGCAAEARANPEGIRQLFKDNGDGTFDVTLHIRKHPMMPPEPTVFRVDARLPAQGGTPIYAKLGAKGADGEEAWMALIEKALAQHTGSYDKISGGQIAKSMNFRSVHELLTGNTADFHRISSSTDPDLLLKQMNDALERKKPIFVGTRSFEEGVDDALEAEARALNIYGNHAYSVESVDIAKRTVTLQNPWGRAHPKDLPIDEVKRFYTTMNVGQPAANPNKAITKAQPEGGGLGDGLTQNLFGNFGDNAALAAARAESEVMARSVGSARMQQEAATAYEDSQKPAITERDLRMTWKAIQREFDANAKGFGIEGEFNEASGKAFQDAIWQTAVAGADNRIRGYYQGRPAVFFVDSANNSVVVTDPQGFFLSAMSLEQPAIASLMSTGSLD